MRTTSFIAALLASTALAACGGGEEPAADTTESAETESMDTGATETAADMADESDTESEAPMEEPEAAPMGGGESESMDAPAEDEAPAEDAPAEDAPADDGAMDEAMAGDDGQFMVAGLTGDPEQGRRVFARCRSCHVLEEGVNRVGPSLYGIFGRETGSVEGFRYSEANANAGITWTHETMFEYLENPREYIPGTIMAFPGLRDEQDRADVVAYIAANGGEG